MHVNVKKHRLRASHGSEAKKTKAIALIRHALEGLIKLLRPCEASKAL